MGLDIYSILNGVTSGNALVPARDPGAVTGSAFIQNNLDLTGNAREQNILGEFEHGNIPDFLRNFVPVTVTSAVGTITYLVTSDVLCLGSNEDYVRMPMTPLTAQAIANQYDCTLPTRKIANDIWAAAPNKLTPLPWGPPFDGDMLKTYRIGVHNSRIQAQLNGMNAQALITGHKKDVVLTNKLAPNNPNQRVAIYGWIQPSGQPIQGLNPVSHEVTYADYSHGIRLIANDVMINNQAGRITDVFSDPTLCSLISDEGPLTFYHN